MRSISGQSPTYRDRRTAARPTVSRSGAFQRPGTVMVFVLGILTLLALVGIGLIASTRMDAKRVDNQSNITSTSDSINSIVKQVQETLRQDIWGAQGSMRPLDNSLPVGSGINPLSITENNEPYDGYHVDRWLSPLMPYPADVTSTNPAMALGSIPVLPAGLPAGSKLFTGNSNVLPIVIGTNAPAGEIDVLVWPAVSYLGSDLLIPKTGVAGGQTNEFAWLYNTRNNVPGQLVRYGPNTPPALNALPVAPDLINVPVIQTWPPQPTARWLYDANGNPLPMIPGSTTNATIRVAKEAWTNTQEAAINSQMQLTNPAFRARFPYFDTNGDGVVDLYDADGDGVPDSPISFVLDGNASNPQSPSKLYAIIRVIDHGAMLNANVASSFAFSQNPPTALMFDEQNANLQRRGRRATELLLDDVAHTRDIFSLGVSNRAWQLVNYRTRFSPAINDPLAYDQNVVRRDLIGGLTGNFGYRLFGLSDEASLRHRFSLVPAAYGSYSKAPPTNGVGYDKIDSALPWSLLWSNTLADYSVPGSYPTKSYEQNTSRWSRMNANFQEYGTATTYDGWDINKAYNIGWRRMFNEAEPFSIRRPMFTAISRDVMLPPADLTLNFTTGELAQLPPGGFPVMWLNSGPGGTTAPLSIIMNDPTDPWPMTSASVPDWMKLQPIDINMTGTTAASAPALQAKYMKYLASAMFIALGGVTDASGLVIASQTDPMRFEYAWQFAANVADYRDSDGVPTAIQLPTMKILHGLEKQPFFTEAYTRVQYNLEDPPTPESDDDWFDAVELFVPPTWLVKIDNLYLRTPGSGSASGLNLGIPLSGFLRAGAPPVLDGNETSTATNIDTNGAYFVFCGPTGAAPPTFSGGITPALAFYMNAGFEFDHDDSAATPGKVELVYADPADPLSVHVLDTIEFNRNGNTVPGSASTGGPVASVDFRWAKRSGTQAANTAERFSMARSTKGWRFTIARYQLLVENNAGGQPNFETLGRANTGQLDPSLAIDELPEMPWPSRSKLDHSTDSEVLNGFSSGQPYEAFDSVVDISRIPMVGNSNLPPAAVNTVPLTYDTATQTLWETIVRQLGTPGGLGPQLAVAAAHVDFANATRVSMLAPNFNTTPPTGGVSQPWSWRLLRYLTATAHTADRIDNDGDGVIDNDAEGANTLFRMAGRININTAPATVLRSVPSMSLLPDSLQFQQLLRISGETILADRAASDPYAYYATAAPFDRQRFWDFASAIVAAREGRDVHVRQPDSLGNLRTVAICQPPAAGAGRVYESVGELMDALGSKAAAQSLNESLGNNDAMFLADRYTRPGSNLPLMGHRLGVNGDAEYGPVGSTPTIDYRAFSPDFRDRKAVAASGEVQTIEFTPVGPGDADTNIQSGGIRGRDIYLSRWANVLTTRSDVFTAYIALIDEDGKYVRRAQVTLDRSNCFGEQRVGGGLPSKAVLPDILLMEEGSYGDDMR